MKKRFEIYYLLNEAGNESRATIVAKSICEAVIKLKHSRKVHKVLSPVKVKPF